MNILTNEIVRAAKVSNIYLEQLSKSEKSIFWQKIKSTHKVCLDGQIWCQLNFSFNESNPEGWRRAGDYFDSWPVLLFCDHHLDTPVFKVQYKQNLVDLLGESFGFVFYLTDLDIKQLVVFDDHDCLRVLLP